MLSVTVTFPCQTAQNRLPKHCDFLPVRLQGQRRLKTQTNEINVRKAAVIKTEKPAEAGFSDRINYQIY